MGYRFISPLVEKMAEKASSLGESIASGAGRLASNVQPVVSNLTKGVTDFISKVPQNISNLLYSTPTRQALTKSTIGTVTVNTTVPIVAHYLKVNNPGDLGFVWNSIMDGDFESARDVALNGVSRMLEKNGENNDPISRLSLPQLE